MTVFYKLQRMLFHRQKAIMNIMKRPIGHFSQVGQPLFFNYINHFKSSSDFRKAPKYTT